MRVLSVPWPTSQVWEFLILVFSKFKNHGISPRFVTFLLSPLFIACVVLGPVEAAQPDSSWACLIPTHGYVTHVHCLAGHCVPPAPAYWLSFCRVAAATRSPCAPFWFSAQWLWKHPGACLLLIQRRAATGSSLCTGCHSLDPAVWSQGGDQHLISSPQETGSCTLMPSLTPEVNLFLITWTSLTFICTEQWGHIKADAFIRGAAGTEIVQYTSEQDSSAQSLSHVRPFATPWIAACQASLSFTNSQRLLTLMSIKSVTPSNHLILCRARQAVRIWDA